ncbi:hypothetical protein JCM17961_23540 [Endothiovibrio diazotrophicus]
MGHNALIPTLEVVSILAWLSLQTYSEKTGKLTKTTLVTNLIVIAWIAFILASAIYNNIRRIW